MSVGAEIDVEGAAISWFGGGGSDGGKEMTSIMSCPVSGMIPSGCDIGPTGELAAETEICWVCSRFGDISLLKSLDSNGGLMTSLCLAGATSESTVRPSRWDESGLTPPR